MVVCELNNEIKLARTIVAHLAWQYRYSQNAYYLVRDKETAPKLLVDLAYYKAQALFDVYYSSKGYLKDER